MIHERCPRCGSPRVCEPYFISNWNGSQRTSCRDAWHMPSIQTEAAEALDFVAGVEALFSGDTAPPILTPDGMSRESTSGYP